MRIMSWRTMDTSGMEGRQRQQYEDLKETFALPKELRLTRTAVTWPTTMPPSCSGSGMAMMRR